MARSRHRTTTGGLDLGAVGYKDVRRLSSPLAVKLSELDVHVRTLDMGMKPLEMLARLVAADTETEEDEALILALWGGLIIQYCRCFEPSYGKGLDATAALGEDPELRVSHDNVLSIRSKHLAHDVNGWRFSDIGVEIRSDGSMGELVRSFGHVMPSGSDVVGLIELTRRASKYASAERMRVKDALVAELHEMEPASRLALPPLRYQDLHKTPIKSSRR